MNTTIIGLNKPQFLEVAKYYSWGKFNDYELDSRLHRIYLDSKGEPRGWNPDTSKMYDENKEITFVEWIQLTNPKPKQESKMKYVVEVNNQLQADTVYQHVDPKNVHYHTKVEEGDPRVITSCGKNGGLSYAQNKDHLQTYGPILKFEDWVLMFGIKPLKPKKKLKLTNDYTAEVDYNTEIVQVGCQSIPFATVEQLAKLIKE